MLLAHPVLPPNPRLAKSNTYQLAFPACSAGTVQLGQDRKLIALTGREWRQWAERTPFWPDLGAIGAIGWPWVIALPFWLLVTWVETRAAAVPTGLWYLIPELPY